MLPSAPSRPLHALGWAAAAALLLAAPAVADDGSYGYFRVIEGSATVTQAGSGSRADAELNQPVLAGDRLWVPRSGRVEVVLSDRNLLRVDGGTELLFERLADSPESDDRQTVLRLLEGNVQLVARRGGRELPRIDTHNATVYVQDAGTYRIATGEEGWTEVVVRDGYAEVVTERGSAVVREDEQAWVEGAESPDVDVQAAGSRDALERWARRLDDEVDGDRYASYVDEDLRYQAAPLRRYGSWVNHDSSWVWRPHVAAGWRPYHYGRWSYTPAGYFWLTAEPWGWVPYHYGTWDYVPAYGWVWYPGRRFAPAWVYWHWGPSYVGWCPIGYYTNWYGRRWHGPGFRWGTYGWAGGDWGHFGYWNFVPYQHFRGRDLHRWARSGRDLRDTRPGGPGRGILTTDTRSLTPDAVGDPRRVQEVLRRRDVTPRGAGGDLPDVTPFVERRDELPPEVRRTVVTDRPAPEGSPLRPRVVVERRDGGERGAADVPRVAGRDPGEGRESAGPRVVPARPSRPASDGGDQSWRVRGRDLSEGGERGASDSPRVVPARPRPPANDTDTDESWRVRGRDRGSSGETDAPRAVPARPRPETGGGDRSYRSVAPPRRDGGDRPPSVRSMPPRPAPSAPPPNVRSRPTYRAPSPSAPPQGGGYSRPPRASPRRAPHPASPPPRAAAAPAPPPPALAAPTRAPAAATANPAPGTAATEATAGRTRSERSEDLPPPRSFAALRMTNRAGLRRAGSGRTRIGHRRSPAGARAPPSAVFQSARRSPAEHPAPGPPATSRRLEPLQFPRPCA